MHELLHHEHAVLHSQGTVKGRYKVGTKLLPAASEQAGRCKQLQSPCSSSSAACTGCRRALGGYGGTAAGAARAAAAGMACCKRRAARTACGEMQAPMSSTMLGCLIRLAPPTGPSVTGRTEAVGQAGLACLHEPRACLQLATLSWPAAQLVRLLAEVSGMASSCRNMQPAPTGRHLSTSTSLAKARRWSSVTPVAGRTFTATGRVSSSRATNTCGARSWMSRKHRICCKAWQSRVRLLDSCGRPCQVSCSCCVRAPGRGTQDNPILLQNAGSGASSLQALGFGPAQLTACAAAALSLLAPGSTPGRGCAPAQRRPSPAACACRPAPAREPGARARSPTPPPLTWPSSWWPPTSRCCPLTCGCWLCELRWGVHAGCPPAPWAGVPLAPKERCTGRHGASRRWLQLTKTQPRPPCAVTCTGQSCRGQAGAHLALPSLEGWPDPCPEVPREASGAALLPAGISMPPSCSRHAALVSCPEQGCARTSWRTAGRERLLVAQVERADALQRP